MKYNLLSLLTGSAALALVASAATAADLPAPAPPPPIVVAPIFTWTGFYAGVNAGWGWLDNNNSNGIFVPSGTFGPPYGGVSGILGGGGAGGNNDGFVGGGQIGYNYQFGTFVVGVEADIQWADFNVENSVFFTPAGFPPSFVPAAFRSDDMEWFGTVRARAGAAFDRFLIYATGGLAYSDNNTGWTVGGGVEWALPTTFLGSSAVTLGVEGLWVSLERDDDNNGGFVGTYVPLGTTIPVSIFAPVASSNDNEFFVARAKLNFKFGTW